MLSRQTQAMLSQSQGRTGPDVPPERTTQAAEWSRWEEDRVEVGGLCRESEREWQWRGQAGGTLGRSGNRQVPGQEPDFGLSS